jgi:hypothetical protein
VICGKFCIGAAAGSKVLRKPREDICAIDFALHEIDCEEYSVEET